MPVFKLVITNREREALSRLAKSEKRSVEGQAGVLIRTSLVQLGLLSNSYIKKLRNDNSESTIAT